MAQRHRHQERRLRSKFGLNIPALDVAADLTAWRDFGTYKQEHTDGNTIVFDEVAILWKRRRRLSSAELLQSALPKFAVKLSKPTRKKNCDGGNVALADLAATQSRAGRHHLHRHDTTVT